MSQANQEDDGRMDFEEAVRYVTQRQAGTAAFSAMPVFAERTDDAEQRAEGARVFVLEGDGAGGYRVHFVAGPFFANAFAANETIAAADVPDRVKELRFMPTRLEDEWLSMQVQNLIQNLVKASGAQMPEMPDYDSAPTVKAAADAVFPISFIERGESS